MERVPVATSPDGVDVHIGKHAEHLELHTGANVDLLGHVVELVENAELDMLPDVFDHDIGRVIGENHLVALQPGDHVLYALRLGREIPTPFVFGRNPEPTTYLSVVFERVKYGRELVSVWHGPLAPDLPGGRAESPESAEFWASHAFVWGAYPIVEGSETPVEHWSPS